MKKIICGTLLLLALPFVVPITVNAIVIPPDIEDPGNPSPRDGFDDPVFEALKDQIVGEINSLLDLRKEARHRATSGNPLTRLKLPDTLGKMDRKMVHLEAHVLLFSPHNSNEWMSPVRQQYLEFHAAALLSLSTHRDRHVDGEAGGLDDALRTLKEQVLDAEPPINAILPGGASDGGNKDFCHDFNANLYKGDSGSEVIALQRAPELNLTGYPLLSVEPGAFGSATFQGVVAFQEKYSAEILTPAGLGKGNGVVFWRTRAKLNQLYGCNGAPTPPGDPTLPPLPIPPPGNPTQPGPLPTPVPDPIPLPADSKPKGFHDTLSCAVAQGWACDGDDYSKPIEVYLKDGKNGSIIVRGMADITREVAVGTACGGNRAHGWKLSLPVSINDGKTHKIYAYGRDLNTTGEDTTFNEDKFPSTLLTSSPRQVTCSSSTPTPPASPAPTPSPTGNASRPTGYHDTFTCSVAQGWACDGDDYTKAIRVHFYKDGPYGGGGTYIGETTANRTREAAVGVACGNGHSAHGFSFSIPDSLKDGVQHSLYVHAIDVNGQGDNPLLTSTPRSATCPAPGAPLSGLDQDLLKQFASTLMAAQGVLQALHR